MEQEHGAKIDGYKFITKTIEDHTKRLERIENKLKTHDAKIFAMQNR